MQYVYCSYDNQVLSMDNNNVHVLP